MTDRFPHEERDEERAAGTDCDRHDEAPGTATYDTSRAFPPDSYPDFAKRALKKLPLPVRRNR